MIRPLTIATFLLACGSGLYLYQSKHEVQLLDRTIERTVHDTNTLREQSRLLAAEWTMLNDPERLRQFSDTYLSLKTITPSQFTSLADLDNRLPAPRFEVPANGAAGEEPASTVSEMGGAGSVDPETDPVPAADVPAVSEPKLPVPPIPVVARAPAVPVVPHSGDAFAPRLGDPRAVDRALASRPSVADGQTRSASAADGRSSEQRPAEPRLVERPTEPRSAERPAEPRLIERTAEPRSVEQRVAPRLADGRSDVRTQSVLPPRPQVAAPVAIAQAHPAGAPPSLQASPVQASARTAQGTAGQTGAAGAARAQPPSRPSVVAASAPFNGSLLGMAHGSAPPAPRPTPVNAAYNSN